MNFKQTWAKVKKVQNDLRMSSKDDDLEEGSDDPRLNKFSNGVRSEIDLITQAVNVIPLWRALKKAYYSSKARYNGTLILIGCACTPLLIILVEYIVKEDIGETVSVILIAISFAVLYPCSVF